MIIKASHRLFVLSLSYTPETHWVNCRLLEESLMGNILFYFFPSPFLPEIREGLSDSPPPPHLLVLIPIQDSLCVALSNTHWAQYHSKSIPNPVIFQRNNESVLCSWTTGAGHLQGHFWVTARLLSSINTKKWIETEAFSKLIWKEGLHYDKKHFSNSGQQTDSHEKASWQCFDGICGSGWEN